jgi:hypothetical protein
MWQSNNHASTSDFMVIKSDVYYIQITQGHNNCHIVTLIIRF